MSGQQMPKEISRSRAMNAGLLQSFGGLLLSVGAFGAYADGSLWQAGLAAVAGIYFLATGSFRWNEARKSPKQK